MLYYLEKWNLRDGWDIMRERKRLKDRKGRNIWFTDEKMWEPVDGKGRVEVKRLIAPTSFRMVYKRVAVTLKGVKSSNEAD